MILWGRNEGLGFQMAAMEVPQVTEASSWNLGYVFLIDVLGL